MLAATTAKNICANLGEKLNHKEHKDFLCVFVVNYFLRFSIMSAN